MKLYNLLIGIMLLTFVCAVSAITVNGRFTVIDSASSKLSVLVQINTSTGIEDLGGTTIVFGFDASALSYPDNPVMNVDYIFHNFYESNYSPGTVTRPMNDKIWVNIDLPYSNNNNGTVVAQSPEWTDVVTVIFDIVDPEHSENLSWLTSSPFWGIFDADNSTLWEIGVFEDFPTSVDPVSDLPVDFELSQNYPNPFNPSTKIRYQVPDVSFVTLIVYDILGNEIATLVNEEKQAGSFEVDFNSVGITSGVYFYKLQSGSFIQSKKMLLLR